MITNKDFRLRLLEENDLTWLKNLREHPSTNQSLGTFCLLNDAKQKAWFNSLQNDSKRCYMVFEKEMEGNFQKIGMVRITEIDLINKSMCVGGDMALEHRGCGYAKEMYNLIFKYGFDCMNMHRLWLLVLENNIIAKSLYEKMGFIKEGVQREAVYSNGRYMNYEMMSILKSEYLEKKNV